VTEHRKFDNIKFWKVMVFFLFFVVFVSLHPLEGGETEGPGSQDISDISLNDLLDVELVSASKKSESLFDSPLSASVLTRREIRNAGVTSIMEALRLVPGLIVREQSAGNFDIHIRGFDNVPPKAILSSAANSITLVMIDNRIVYNYFNGGTFWETLPVDLNDVERIEVVRGPAAALYGPNAVSGVINIITRGPEKKGIYNNFNLLGGSSGTLFANGSAGYKGDKLSTVISANYTHRKRTQTSYYEYQRGKYIDDVSQIRNSNTGAVLEDYAVLYADPSLAVKKYGVNGFLGFNSGKSLVLKLAGGYQDSSVQKAFIENRTSPFLRHDSSSGYLDLSMNWGGLSARASYLSGSQDAVGTNGFQYDMNVFDAVMEYDWNMKKISLRPGVWYSSTTYDGDFIGGEQKLRTTALSLRAEFRPTDRLRLVAAVRRDKYRIRDKADISFQLAATLKISENHLLRAVFSRANRSPFMLNSFMNFTASNPFVSLLIEGNQKLDLMTMDMIEVGYRVKLSKRLQADVEASYEYVKNYDDLIQSPPAFVQGKLFFYSVFRNLPVTANQKILTLTLNYNPGGGFTAKFFASLQETKLKDFSPSTERLDETVDIKHENTPKFYGGLIMNYSPAPKINLNSNIYFYTGQTYMHIESVNSYSNQVVHDGIGPVPGKVIVNMKAAYEISPGLSIFLNVRNLFNNDAAEFGFTDFIKGLYALGLSYEMN
jgi:iron complex outermembrane receptor protein